MPRTAPAKSRLTEQDVMRAYALLIDAGWVPPKRNGTVDDVRAAIEIAIGGQRS